jgi:hypothetical protein
VTVFVNCELIEELRNDGMIGLFVLKLGKVTGDN